MPARNDRSGAAGSGRQRGSGATARRRRLAFVAALVWASMLASALHRAVAAAEPLVDRISIEGNSRVDEEAIRVHLRSMVGAPLDGATVARDIRAVHAMGFFKKVEADWEEVAGEHVLTFRVVEHPLIRDIRIEGTDKVDTEEIEAVLEVRRHTILDPVKARAGIAAAKKLYEEDGFLDAEIEQRVIDVGNNEVDLEYVIDEKELIRIRKIEFEGNEAFSDRKLRRVMATKQKWLLSRITGAGLLKRDVLKTDTERLAAFYYEHGYITVRVDEPQVERRAKGLYVTIKIGEGDQYRVGTLSLEGGEEAISEPDVLLDGLDLKKDAVFSASALRRDVETITDVISDKGFAFGTVEPITHIRPERRLVDVEFRVTAGVPVYIDKIEIVGNVKTRDKVLRRELRLQEQDLFSGTKLRESRTALQRLGFFRSVNLETRQTAEADRLDVTVNVEEGQTGSFSAGAGFSSADRLLFNVRISENNLFGRGQRLVLNGDFGSLRRNLVLSFTEPYFLDNPLTLGVDAFNWRLLFDDFAREGTGFGLRLLYPLTELGFDDVLGFSLADVRAGFSYRLEKANITDLSTAATRSLRFEEGQKLISSITPRLRRSTLNHAFDPTGGSLEDLSIEIAGLGGDTTFLKAEARMRWFYSFWDSPRFGTFTYSVGGRVGWGLGNEGIDGDELPLFERYFPGGLDSVRGFKIRTLGPREVRRDTFGKVVDRTTIGGSRQLILNNEVIFPIVKGLGLKGVLFFDAGEAFTAADGIRLGDMRYAAGGGVRWLSPFGPLRMELGIPLNPRPDDSKSVVLFSFGGVTQ